MYVLYKIFVYRVLIKEEMLSWSVFYFTHNVFIIIKYCIRNCVLVINNRRMELTFYDKYLRIWLQTVIYYVLSNCNNTVALETLFYHIVSPVPLLKMYFEELIFVGFFMGELNCSKFFKKIAH